MRHTLHLLLSAITAATLVAGCAPAASEIQTLSEPKTVVIAVQPTDTPEKLSTDAKELEQYLESRVGIDVEMRFPTNYAGVIEALNFGHAHAAFMSAWPASLAQRRAGGQVALAEIREVVIDDKKEEAPYYYSYWIVLKDSPITTMEQLRGKRVALPSPLSTSGYVAPLARLVELGLLQPETGKEADPKKFFGEVFLAGGYAQGWEALKAGQVDAAVIAGDVNEKLYREVLAATRVVEKQGPIPSHAIVFSKDLHPATREKLQTAFIDLGAPDKRDLMRKFVSGIFVGFKPTTGPNHLAALDKYLSLTNFSFEGIR